MTHPSYGYVNMFEDFPPIAVIKRTRTEEELDFLRAKGYSEEQIEAVQHFTVGIEPSVIAKISIPETQDDDENIPIPERKQLNILCSPNPFNTTVRIDFYMPLTQPATITIIDVSGNLIETVFSVL
jgi:hypothetical protein